METLHCLSSMNKSKIEDDLFDHMKGETSFPKIELRLYHQL
jgi:hypothetical protein